MSARLNDRAGFREHMGLILVQGAFVVGAVEGKLAMAPGPAGGHVSPLALAMVRMVGAAIFFQAFLRARARMPVLSRRVHLRFVGLGLLGVVINQGLFLMGLHLTHAVSATLV